MEGTDLPERIANAPQLELGLELFYEAFWDLSTCREFGMSMGPIPWLAILQYAMAFGFDEEQLEDLSYYVRLMDEEWRKHHAPKSGKDGGIGSGKKRGAGPKTWRPARRSRSSRKG